jgi:hypothetical protein
MDGSNPYEAPRSNLSPPESGPNRLQSKRESAVAGLLVGPLLGVLFTEARIGPAGHLWWEAKGGETILTSSGKTIAVIVIVCGAIAGALCGLLLEAKFPPRAREDVASRR